MFSNAGLMEEKEATFTMKKADGWMYRCGVNQQQALPEPFLCKAQ
jgi:hypothetical protein